MYVYLHRIVLFDSAIRMSIHPCIIIFEIIIFALLDKAMAHRIPYNALISWNLNFADSTLQSFR